MPRVIANTAFAGRLEEITELQTNLSITSPWVSPYVLEELNFYIPGKSPANIANTAFAGRLENIINLQDYVNDFKVIQFGSAANKPYPDPSNVFFLVDIAMPLADATRITTFAFSYDSTKSYTVTSVDSSILNPGKTTVTSTFDSNVYDLTAYASEIQNSYIIPNYI